MKTNCKCILGTLSILVAISCSHDPRENDRKFVSKGQLDPLIEPNLPPLKSIFEEEGPVLSACEELAAKKIGETPESRAGLYRFMRGISQGSKGITGSVEPGGFPILQMKVGEGIPDGNEDAFWEEVQRKHAAGQIVGMKYLLLQSLKAVGKLDLVMPAAISDSLSEAFPGIFGSDQDFSKSLPLLLTRKAVGTGTSLVLELQDSLIVKPLDLFPETLEWSDWADEVAKDLKASIDVLRNSELGENEAQERLCALTLWHRTFAQLLAIKGYTRPEIFIQPTTGRTYLKELNKKNPTFARLKRTGAFFEAATGEALVLSPQDIAQYNPATRYLWSQRNPPASLAASEVAPASLTQHLAMMKGMAAIYQATHPASAWFEGGEKYLLGDIQNPANKAIIPYETHSLALGLLTMSFKSVGANAIVKLNAQGMQLKPGEKAAGVAIVERRGLSPNGRVRLADASALIDVVVAWHYGLKTFIGKDPLQWGKIHPMYTQELLAKLMGRSLFTEAQLLEILPDPNDRAMYLRETLNSLSLPLALSAIKLAEAREGCVGQATINLDTGAMVQERACTAEEKSAYKRALRNLALETRSPLLMSKSQEK